MKNLLKGAVMLVLMMSLTITSFAVGSKTGSRSSSGGDGSDSDGSSVYTSATVREDKTPETEGSWTMDEAGNWHFLSPAGIYYASQWIYAKNPYANNAKQWFYMDGSGNMLTGWTWIAGPDGLARCYYLNPVSDGSKGKAQLNGTTPDGYQLNKDGAWTVEGIVQTR